MSSDDAWSGSIDVTNHQIEYLVAMARTGLYGSTPDEVVISLVLAGIREAVDRGFIKKIETK